MISEYLWLGWEPVAVIEGGVVCLIRADHIGRPAFATTLAGTKVWSATYLPFGGVHVTTGAPIDARFPGQWFQAESGLHQNWMRDYDPTTGRYLQADPLGLVDGASVYGYARQSPMRFTDPTGECPFCVIGASVLISVATGYLTDQAFGDGCYTSDELALDILLGIALSPLAKSALLGDDLLRAAAKSKFKRFAPVTAKDLVQSAATRADAWGARQGMVASAANGSRLHSYARELLTRYERRYGGPKLAFEESRDALGGSVKYGSAGSLRADVYDPVGNAVYDWKFFGAADISPSRAAEFRRRFGATTVETIRP